MSREVKAYLQAATSPHVPEPTPDPQPYEREGMRQFLGTVRHLDLDVLVTLWPDDTTRTGEVTWSGEMATRTRHPLSTWGPPEPVSEIEVE